MHLILRHKNASLSLGMDINYANKQGKKYFSYMQKAFCHDLLHMIDHWFHGLLLIITTPHCISTLWHNTSVSCDLPLRNTWKKIFIGKNIK